MLSVRLCGNLGPHKLNFDIIPYQIYIEQPREQYIREDFNNPDIIPTCQESGSFFEEAYSEKAQAKSQPLDWRT